MQFFSADCGFKGHVKMVLLLVAKGLIVQSFMSLFLFLLKMLEVVVVVLVSFQEQEKFPVLFMGLFFRPLSVFSMSSLLACIMDEMAVSVVFEMLLLLLQACFIARLVPMQLVQLENLALFASIAFCLDGVLVAILLRMNFGDLCSFSSVFLVQNLQL